MFSLSYLPTAERLTVVVVKARNLKLNEDQQNVFVKVSSTEFFYLFFLMRLKFSDFTFSGLFVKR